LPILAWISYSVLVQTILLYVRFQLCFALICLIMSVFLFQLYKLVMMHKLCRIRRQWKSRLLSQCSSSCIIDQTCQSLGYIIYFSTLTRNKLGEKTEAEPLSTYDDSMKQMHG